MTRQRFTRERELHQRRRDVHPVEGQRESRPAVRRNAADIFGQDEFPGHHESERQLHESQDFDDDAINHLYEPEDTSVPQRVKIDKSNILLIGPTGVGKTYILE